MDANMFIVFLACLISSITSMPLKEIPSDNEEDSKNNQNSNDDNELEHPEIFSRIVKINKGNHNITQLIIEGDILKTEGRSAKRCTTCLWPKSADGTVPVPYDFSSTYDNNQKNLFIISMQEYESLTCVRFVKRTEEQDYLNIVSSNGCSSNVGRLGGAQSVYIDAYGCMLRGIIQHELEHVLGFYHEISRSDRDDHVTIMTQYISPDDLVNFAVHDTNNLGLAYDYNSVMHYGNYAFSNTSNQPTIVPTPNPNVPIGQRDGLSVLDVAKINTLYNCDVCSTLLPNTNGTLTSSNYPSAYPNNANCVWLIRTPSGQVTLNFNGYDIQSSPDCVSDYIKIYDGPSKTSPVLLDKTCGTGLIPPLIASTSQILVEFVSDSSVTGVGFKATYGSVQCGGLFYAFQGNFTSPGYPIAYGPNMDCIFTITAPAGHRISLAIRDFQLESASFCKYDYMKIQYGTILKGPFCGSSPILPITSTGNSLKLTFHSDQSNQMRGFQVSYTFI